MTAADEGRQAVEVWTEGEHWSWVCSRCRKNEGGLRSKRSARRSAAGHACQPVKHECAGCRG